MIGPGKYDAVAEQARRVTEATGVLLVVIDGNQGNGFSVPGPRRQRGTSHFSRAGFSVMVCSARAVGGRYDPAKTVPVQETGTVEFVWKSGQTVGTERPVRTPRARPA
jgi:hypothetical protein